MRWIAEIGSDLPDPVQRRLRSAFFTSTLPLAVGAINTIAVAGVAYLRSHDPAFAAIALTDLLLLVVRLVLLRRVNAPSGPIFATGLLWAALQGATITLVVQSADVTMSIIVLASGLAAIGGIIGRNFAAPRYAMAQLLIIDLSYKISFCLIHPEFLPLILLQTVVFVLMNHGILKQHRTAAIQAILGELESRRQSITDPLTGLVNRRGLEDAFDALRHAGRNPTLFYLDLDGFKQVNDRLGHGAGDMVLRETGQRLRETLGPVGVACRLGGDEFLLLVDRLDPRDAHRLGTRIVTVVDAPYRVAEGVSAEIGVSIGIAQDQTGSLALADMMQRADQALYAAKVSGKGQCILHGTTGTPLDNAA